MWGSRWRSAIFSYNFNYLGQNLGFLPLRQPGKARLVIAAITLITIFYPRATFVRPLTF